MRRGQSGKRAGSSPRDASWAVLKPLPQWTQPGMSPDAEGHAGWSLCCLEPLHSAAGHPGRPEDRHAGSRSVRAQVCAAAPCACCSCTAWHLCCHYRRATNREARPTQGWVLGVEVTELLEGDTEPFSFIHLWWLWIPWPCWLVEGTGSRSEEPETAGRRAVLKQAAELCRGRCHAAPILVAKAKKVGQRSVVTQWSLRPSSSDR